MMKILSLTILALGCLVANNAWSFAFYVVKGGSLDSDDQGVPVIWREQNVAIGIGFSQQSYANYVFDAMAEWNDVGADIALQEGANYGSPCSSNDGMNSINFTADTCTGGWGDAIGLTITKGLIDAQGGYITEADVLIRSFIGDPTSNWTSPEDPNNSTTKSCYANAQGGKTCDFRRVVLHELGHVLGLNHPDEESQDVPAVMNSGSLPSNVIPGQLANDDINGLNTIYARGRASIDGTAGLASQGSTTQKDYSASAAVDREELVTLLVCLVAVSARRLGWIRSFKSNLNAGGNC